MNIDKRIPTLIKLTTVSVLSILLSACSLSDAETSNEQPYYHLAQGLKLSPQESYQVERQFVGSVQVNQNASIGFEQAGKIAEIYIDSGEFVTQGTILASQDTELLTIERKELQAQLRQTQADLNLVVANLKRLRALSSRGYASDQSIDELQARQKALSANRQRITASLSANQLRIDKSTLMAPFEGIISHRHIDRGEVVNAGSPAFTLLQQGESEVKVGVPINILPQLKQQKNLNITINNVAYPATLITQGADVDQISRTVQLRFALPANSDVVNGELAYLQLPQHYQVSGFWVPLSALTDTVRGLWTVYQLQPTDSPELFQLESRNIKVAYTTATAAYITGALQADIDILATGTQRLVAGQRVRVTSLYGDNEVSKQ
ncbi:MAG: efflux RND transporter periplasmic adaptor subunit [Amphritea sp.]